MNKLNIFKKVSVALVAVTAAVLISAGSVSAIVYNGDQTVASPTPAFNVFTGAPAPAGNEPDFLKARVPANGNDNDTTAQYADPLNAGCTNGERIQMRVYVHNGASADANNNGSGPSVAHGTKVKVALPGNEASSFNPSATISASNATSVNDNVTINCNGQSVKLQYIPGSASQFSNGTGVMPLSDSIVSSGVPIQSHSVPGDVWGCWNERVYVVLAVKVVVTPPQPEKTAQCDLFNMTATENRKVKVSEFKFSANNANFKQAVINWGDNSSKVVTDSNAVIGQEHQYKENGKYSVSVTVTFDAGGQTITSGGAGTACAKQVTFTPNQPPSVTPPTTVGAGPTSLVNTGPGSAVAAFAAATIAGTLGYRRLLSRRLGQQ